jgi:hypothetical protein
VQIEVVVHDDRGLLEADARRDRRAAAVVLGEEQHVLAGAHALWWIWSASVDLPQFIVPKKNVSSAIAPSPSLTLPCAAPERRAAVAPRCRPPDRRSPDVRVRGRHAGVDGQ